MPSASLLLNDSNDSSMHRGKSFETCGGVGRNIANALMNLGLNPTPLISVVGDDDPGKAIIKSLGNGGQTVDRLSNTSTPRCTLIIDNKGELHFGIGDMDAFASITPNLVKKYRSHIEKASLIVLDGNLPVDTIQYVLDLAAYSEIPVWYEPTDVKEATKIFEAKKWHNVLHFISPNRDECKVIGKYLGIQVSENKSIMDLEEIRTIAEQVAEFVPVVITTVGSQGVMVVRKALENDPFYDKNGKLIENTTITSRLYPPLSCTSEDRNKINNANGCGDCLSAGIIYGIHKNLCEIDCLSLALKAAALSLMSSDAVPSLFSLYDDINCYKYIGIKTC